MNPRELDLVKYDATLVPTTAYLSFCGVADV